MIHYRLEWADKTPFLPMNWLAHLLLSEATPAFRIGNLMPDMLGHTLLTEMPERFQSGIRRHRQIDSYTDSHPVVRRSIERIQPPFRRYAGPLTDVFYDHFLSRHWGTFSPQPLDLFIDEVYASFETEREFIPLQAYRALEGMKTQNWLGTYRQVEGIRTTLRRMEGRLKRHFPLSDAVGELELHYERLEADFLEFFPDLVAHVMVD